MYEGGTCGTGDGSKKDDGGAYEGGSRRPCGNGEGVVETWQKGPGIVNIRMCFGRERNPTVCSESGVLVYTISAYYSATAI